MFVSAAVCRMDAAVEFTWTYLQRAEETNIVFRNT